MLSHRLILRPESRLRKVSAATVVAEILDEVAVPMISNEATGHEMVPGRNGPVVVRVSLANGLTRLRDVWLLAILILSRWLARGWIENLAASRECNRLSAEIGERVAVAVTVKNRGRLPVPWVLIEDLLPRAALVQRPPRLRLTGRRLAISMLRGHGRKTVLYQLTFEMRGYYQLGPCVLESGDLFGLHRRFRVASEPTLRYRLSESDSAGRIRHRFAAADRRSAEDAPLVRRSHAHRRRAALPGRRSFESYQLASHGPAPANCTANLYEPSSIAGATILLDFNRASFHARNEPVRSELAITTAASLANAVYQLGQQVGLVTNGARCRR